MAAFLRASGHWWQQQMQQHHHHHHHASLLPRRAALGTGGGTADGGTSGGSSSGGNKPPADRSATTTTTATATAPTSSSSWASSSSSPTTDDPDDALGALLYLQEHAGLDRAAIESALRRNPALARASVSRRVKPMLALLRSGDELGLSASDVSTMLLKCPTLFGASVPHHCRPALAFLRSCAALGPLTREQTASVVRRFPAVLFYSPEGQLAPQVAYLQSLGVQDVQGLVVARPSVLGLAIDPLVDHLVKEQRVARRNVGKLLRTYPSDVLFPARWMKVRDPRALAQGGGGEEEPPPPPPSK